MASINRDAKDNTTIKSAQEKNYRYFVELANEGIWAIDEERITTFVNDRMAGMLGLRPEDMIGRHAADFMFEEDIPAHEKRMLERRSGRDDRYEQRFKRNDGSHVWMKVSATSLREPGGVFRGSFALFEDITEIRQKTRELTESRMDLLSFFDAIPESAFLIDPEGNVITANKVTADRLGRPVEKLAGSNLFELVPGDIAESRRKALKAVLKDKRPMVINDSRDGYEIRSYVYPVQSDNGEIKRIAVIAFDVTGFNQRERMLTRLNNVLDSLKKVQSDFLNKNDHKSAFKKLLDIIVAETGSEYGFIDEVVSEKKGVIYKRSLAISDISWDEGSRKAYDRLASGNFEFRNLNNLAGLPATTGKIVISNDPLRDERAGGIPGGHPAIKSYMGIPVRSKGRTIGVIGVANRDGGYSLDALGDFVKLFLSVCAAIINSLRSDKLKDKYLLMLKEENRKLAALEEKFQTISDFTLDWESWIGPDGNIIFTSPSCSSITGYTQDDFYSNSSLLSGIVTVEDAPAFKEHMEGLFSKWGKPGKKPAKDSAKIEYRINDKDGKTRWVEQLSRPVLKKKDGFSGIRVSTREITDKKAAEDRLLFYSFHDKLTGLYNRAFFDEESKRLDTERYLPISIVMADINGLKLVNDAFGHDSGDELLRKAAGILKKSCRSEDIIARWGGDEFVILLPKTGKERASQIVSDIKNVSLRNVTSKIPLSISLGFSIKEDKNGDISSILKKAEDLMYKNKLLESKSSHSSIIESLKRTLIENSVETEEHSNRVCRNALKLGKVLGLSEEKLTELELHAELHDIGKVGVSQEILMKEGELTPEEWEAVKSHSEIGYRIANSTPVLSGISENILCQHEWWDGSGYPRGLKGKGIPLICRIVAVVDAFDSMMSKTPYASKRSKKEAIEELRRFSGIQFDPEIVRVFIGEIPGENL